MKVVSIRQSLQHVVDNPTLKTDVILDVHTHELVSRTLFDIANGVKVEDRGSLTRANVARTMIFNRLVGRRRAGTHPATVQKVSLEFVNLTGEELEA